MALAGPQLLALRPNGEEDVDFFDQLANQRSDGLLQNFGEGEEEDKEEEEEEGEAGLEVAFSKLCQADHSATTETFISGDQIWMQEKVTNRKIYFNPAVASITGLIDATREISEVNAASYLQDFVFDIVEERKDKVSLDMSSANGNTDVGTPLDVEGDLQDRDSHQESLSNALVDLGPGNHAEENASSALATEMQARSQSLDSNVSTPASFLPVVKELQWSIFSQNYTPDEGSDGLNAFLSELDSETDKVSNQNLGYTPALEVGPAGTANANSISELKGENGNFADENITTSPHFGGNASGFNQLHENGGYGMNSHVSTHQFRSNSSELSGYQGASNQPPGDASVELLGSEIGYNVESKVGGHSVGMHLQGGHKDFNETKQSLVSINEARLQYNSLEYVQLGGSYTSVDSVEAQQYVFSAQQQVYTSQPWESMYPGWYFDYTLNEWKQIEGWNDACSATSFSNQQHVSESAAITGDYSTFGAANAPFQSNFDLGADAIPSHSEFVDGQNALASYNEMADVSGSDSQEQINLTGSEWPIVKEETASTSLGSLLEGEEAKFIASYEERNSDGALQSQMQVPWEEQYPGWYFDYQAQQWRQKTAGNFLDTYGGEVEPSASEEAKPSHQQYGNQSVIQPEGGGAIHNSDVSNVISLTQNLSFQSWGGPAMANNFYYPGSDLTGNTFQVEDGGSSYGVQSHSNGATLYFNQPETPNDNSYSLEPYTQPHNYYGVDKETRFSSDERPSHALVAFGFGGKLMTMKASSNSIPEAVVVHDLNQLIQASADSGQNARISYFSSLNRGGLAGPLVGSGVATKEVLKWVDDEIANCEVEGPQCTESLRVLWGVLRIACVHYGKVRPMHGSSSLKSSSEDGPELELGRLLSTASGGPQVQAFTAASAGLQVTPPEPPLQSIALEMRKRLVEGKRKEALQLAQQGQLWGPALVLASHLGEKAYAGTVLQMSQQQFVPGCPLRTLFLLLGGQTGELFTTISSPSSSGAAIATKDGAGGMLSDWMGNLSIIAANPTNGDEQVITHLGDCLWKDHGEVAGAHTCYLVADTAFDCFSENARLCLVGADHFKWQRTFATPLSIQRTELYEYAKALGNSQFILLPFQPYKLLYAYMLVEAGKVSEARRYCQAVSKALKNGGRTSEIDFCKQAASALEERLRVHSQGGYNLNSATGKIVGKFIGTLDNTLHRIMGGPPRQASEPSLNRNPRDWYSNDKKSVNSSKVGEGSSSDWSVQNESSERFHNRQLDAPSRSISEPNLSWNTGKKDQKAMTSSQTSQVVGAAPQESKSEVRRTGYLGRLLSTAVGFMKSNTKKADLGDNNKFYYNKELKRWVEEGAEHTTEEMPLPPPPITSVFESGSGATLLKTHATTDAEGPGVMGRSSDSLSQMPPLPPSGNQYSARGRLTGLQARYVDTFNKKGTVRVKSTSLPLVLTSGRVTSPSPTQFFMPVQTEISTNSATTASDENMEDLLASLTAGRSTAQNGVSQTEIGAVVRHEPFSGGAFVSETTEYSSQDFARETKCLGEVPSFFTTDGSMNSLQSPLPNHSTAKSSMKLDTYMHSATFSQAVPPFIQPHIPAVGVDDIFSSKSVEHTNSALPTDVHGGILTDMQEVEL